MARQVSGQAQGPALTDDPLPEAVALARGAAGAGLGLKLLGGLAVRVLCPAFPPRQHAGQDMDFACLSKDRKAVAGYLQRSDCQPDRRFNNLNGNRQMRFTAPSGRPVDIVVDRLTMWHMLDLRPAFGRLPLTIDAVDLLLSKLQIVEPSQKDAWDIMHLLSGVPATAPRGGGPDGTRPGTAGADGADCGRAEVSGTAVAAGPADGASIDGERFAKLLGADWGWWRTVTGNLRRLPALTAAYPGVMPPAPPLDPLAQSRYLLEVAESAPKGIKWRLRASIGDRLCWYELPVEAVD